MTTPSPLIWRSGSATVNNSGHLFASSQTYAVEQNLNPDNIKLCLGLSLPSPDWYRHNLLCVQSKSQHISKALNKLRHKSGTQTLYFKLEWLLQNLLGSSFSQVNPFQCSIAIVSFFQRPVISIRVRWKIRIIKMPGNAVHFRSKVFG